VKYLLPISILLSFENADRGAQAPDDKKRHLEGARRENMAMFELVGGYLRSEPIDLAMQRSDLAARDYEPLSISFYLQRSHLTGHAMFVN
jgi:hypothetical protein